MAEKALPLGGFKKYSGAGSFQLTDDGIEMNGQVYLFGYDSNNNSYIEISPQGNTYYYDIIFSNSDADWLLFGFEKFDENKTATSNNSCVYAYTTRAAEDHKRIFGTVDLSKDSNGSPTKYIRFRILNDWDGNAGRQAKVHFLSLREVSTLGKPTVTERGQFTADSFRNTTDGAHIYKNGFVGGTYFYEI